jgi:hypothetical protein
MSKRDIVVTAILIIFAVGAIAFWYLAPCETIVHLPLPSVPARCIAPLWDAR